LPPLCPTRAGDRPGSDPNATTSQDVERLREVGLGDREIFEATAWVAFRLAVEGASVPSVRQALFRTRTGDPFLTMEVLYQLS
jgi:hypothetical protein